MTNLHKFIILWIGFGVVGAISYIYAEHLDGEDITIKDLIFIIAAGMSFGVFMFTISFALLINNGLNRLDKIILIQRKGKLKTN